jgi:hypothetical protein
MYRIGRNVQMLSFAQHLYFTVYSYAKVSFQYLEIFSLLWMVMQGWLDRFAGIDRLHFKQLAMGVLSRFDKTDFLPGYRIAYHFPSVCHMLQLK